MSQELPGTDIRYMVEYQKDYDDSWFVGGDVYGYETLPEAQQVESELYDKPATREFKGTRMERVIRTRIIVQVHSAHLLSETSRDQRSN